MEFLPPPTMIDDSFEAIETLVMFSSGKESVKMTCPVFVFQILRMWSSPAIATSLFCGDIADAEIVPPFDN
jgi:hypothetical protein